MDRLLSPCEVASRLGLRVKTVYALIHDRGLPAFRLGRQFRVKESDLKSWLESQRVQTESEPDWWDLLPGKGPGNNKHIGGTI